MRAFVLLCLLCLLPKTSAQCAAGTYSSTGATACVACPDNTFSVLVGATSAAACAACPANMFSYAGATACLLLWEPDADGDKWCMNSYSQNVMPPCTQCPVGTGASCIARCRTTQDCRCNIGTWGPDGGPCTTCHANAGANCFLATNANYRCNRAIDCKCNAGYTGSNYGSVCTACAPGTYKTSLVGGAACLACPAGTYSDSLAATACVACAAGTYVAAPAVTCVACPAGKYSALVGATECVGCPSGTYSSATGATGVETCLVCPQGTVAPVGSTASAACVCVPGEYTQPMHPTCTSNADMVANTCCSGGIVATGATSGTISQGSEPFYANDVRCTWMLGPAPVISVRFSRKFEVENVYDYVLLIYCTDSLCTNPGSMVFAEFYYGGAYQPTKQESDKFGNTYLVYDPPKWPDFDKLYTTTAGYMQIRFISRRSTYDQTGPQPQLSGFTAIWNTSACTSCGPGTYSAVSGATACAQCPNGAGAGAGSSACTCRPGFEMLGA